MCVGTQWKKRIVAIFMVSMLGLFGCAAPEDASESLELVRADAPTYSDEYITVGFIQTGKESDWRDANTNDFLSTFTRENGYNLIYIDGNSDSDRQIKAMNDLISQEVDYIIIDPIVETGWNDSLLAAQEKGIPVIVSDRMVNADESLYTCWIGSDFETEGHKAAKWLEEYLESVGRTDETIRIVILEGTEGASAAIGRTNGLNAEIEKHENWEVLTTRCANFTQGEGKNIMEEILKEYEDIDVLISENDNMMFGAMKAMEQAGVSYGVDGDVITVSFDALHEAFELMMEGKLMVSVECNPLIAGLSHEVIQKLEAGEEIDMVNYVEESVFSYENAADYINERKY
ncbi:MAG: LacI family transcriptional regulator [Lachnospiraceae bacterium]|nr:LacI family transcriptional regulator [Lachnospiraceae bacterium]